MEVLLGQEVSILCTHSVAAGREGPVLVEWFITDKNGVQRRVAYDDGGQQGMDAGTEYKDRASMDSSHSLVIQAADVSDERTFSCQVTTTSGTGVGETQLKVFDPPETPEVVYNTGTLSVTGDYASEIATCSSKNANPVPTISWYKDGRLLNASTERNKELYVVSRTVKETSGLFSISSTLYMHLKKEDKDSAFHCKVNYSMPQGRVGSTETDSFQLTLHYYTENVEFLLNSPEPIKEGDDVELHCKADGSPSPEYYFSKVQTLDTQAGEAQRDLGSNREGIFRLHRVSKADSGMYRCQVLDFDSPPEVDLEKEVTIFVHYLDPVVVTPSTMVVVNISENIELTCSGTGSRTPELSWKKGGEEVEKGATLTLNSLTYQMAGTYSCKASVSSIPGLEREQAVQVIVEGKPEMEQHQTITHYHALGQTVELTCSVLGHPEPEIQWSIPGEATIEHSGNKLSLELTPELVQSGVTCLAENKHGSDKQMFRFEIVDGQETQGGSTVAVIAVCVCVLLLLIIVGFFYFMQRRGQLPCGGGEKRSLTPKEGNPDDTVVEMKTDRRNEQTGLLSHGGGGGGGTNEC
ncbi:basal cell adhesion molecule isoform X2 [Sceloporus undulatus]|uniref:basal cell adhesion molecule isoform X2 n=1 Tax=Sceloporus undulatus TaxID=8520 RepID=UPI001C4B16A4|nr:basal cell adhesion molecule isoform X2 [Sceloporus undulatus]